MTIIRNIDGKDVQITLNGAELAEAYKEKWNERQHEWVQNLLIDYGYDVAKCDPAMIESLTTDYILRVEEDDWYNDTVGEMQHTIFEEEVRKYHFPELPEEEEDA